MSVLLRTRIITSPRARFQTFPKITSCAAHRPLSSTAARAAGDHAHEDHYDPPGGWLFGVKPGEKYENEGWENVWFCEHYEKQRKAVHDVVIARSLHSPQSSARRLLTRCFMQRWLRRNHAIWSNWLLLQAGYKYTDLGPGRSAAEAGN